MKKNVPNVTMKTKPKETQKQTAQEIVATKINWKAKVAVVQAETCWFNVEAAVEKTCALIAEACANSAELVAFPELWIPGYTNFSYAHVQKMCNEYMRTYFRNSASVDSKHMGQIRLAARSAKISAVLGIAKREKGSLYLEKCPSSTRLRPAPWPLTPTPSRVAPSSSLLPTPNLKQSSFEGLIYAEPDCDEIYLAKNIVDRVGQYSRPDLFTLQVNSNVNRHCVYREKTTEFVHATQYRNLEPPESENASI
ncbi:CN hydrolase domain-containing protein [Fusarium sp. LHS14.1]|nr:CN hydrolase domain-containing protein [Fusarium sp. LHS14.1]